MTISATLLVCDAGQLDSDGRLYLLGAGIQVVPVPSPPHTLVARLQLTPDEALRPHEVRLLMVDPAGDPVMVPGPAVQSSGPAAIPGTSAQPLQLGQDLPQLAASATDLPDWGPVVVPLLFNLGPGLPVRQGPHRWRLSVDGQLLDEAVVLYLEQQQQQQQQG